MIGAVPGSVLFSLVFLSLAAAWWGPVGVFQGEGLARWIAELAGTLPGILIIVLPGQMFFISAAMLPALLSRRPWMGRLGLRRPAISMRTWVTLVLATPVIQVASGLFASLFFDLTEPSQNLQMLETMLTGHTGLGLVFVLFCAAVLPGMSEELFFRGYVRVGLSRRHGFMLAVFVPALFFAAAHMDPIHSTAVLPLGIWFGLIAWWTRSTIPAMLAHALNNSMAILASNFAGEDLEPQTALESITQAQALVVVSYGLSLAFLVIGLIFLSRERARS